MTIRFFCLGFFALAAAAVHAETTLRVGEPIAFVVIDSDRNGYVSRVEARSINTVETRFERADANSDGLLDEDEYGAISDSEAGN